MKLGSIVISFPHLIHVCVEDAILRFWKEWVLEGTTPTKVGLLWGFTEFIIIIDNCWVKYMDRIDGLSPRTHMFVVLRQLILHR